MHIIYCVNSQSLEKNTCSIINILLGSILSPPDSTVTKTEELSNKVFL